MRPLAEYDLLKFVRPVHRSAEDGDYLIEFGRADELLDLGGDEDKDGDEKQTDGGGEVTHEELRQPTHDPIATASGSDGTKAGTADNP